MSAYPPTCRRYERIIEVAKKTLSSAIAAGIDASLGHVAYDCGENAGGTFEITGQPEGARRSTSHWPANWLSSYGDNLKQTCLLGANVRALLRNRAAHEQDQEC